MPSEMSNTHVVVLCSLANFINAADRVIMPIAIIPMTSYFKKTMHWQGWILSAFAFGYLSSQVIINIQLLILLLSTISIISKTF